MNRRTFVMAGTGLLLSPSCFCGVKAQSYFKPVSTRQEMLAESATLLTQYSGRAADEMLSDPHFEELLEGCFPLGVTPAGGKAFSSPTQMLKELRTRVCMPSEVSLIKGRHLITDGVMNECGLKRAFVWIDVRRSQVRRSGDVPLMAVALMDVDGPRRAMTFFWSHGLALQKGVPPTSLRRGVAAWLHACRSRSRWDGGLINSITNYTSRNDVLAITPETLGINARRYDAALLRTSS